MSLKIYNLIKDGDEKKEHIILEAIADVNISDYIIVDRTFDKKGKVSNIHPHIYRFPSKTVKKGDYVCLRTGKGTNNVGTLNSKPLHRFFWGSDEPFWNDDEIEKAELLKVTTVDSKAA